MWLYFFKTDFYYKIRIFISKYILKGRRRHKKSVTASGHFRAKTVTLVPPLVAVASLDTVELARAAARNQQVNGIVPGIATVCDLDNHLGLSTCADRTVH